MRTSIKIWKYHRLIRSTSTKRPAVRRSCASWPVRPHFAAIVMCPAARFCVNGPVQTGISKSGPDKIQRLLNCLLNRIIRDYLSYMTSGHRISGGLRDLKRESHLSPRVLFSQQYSLLLCCNVSVYLCCSNRTMPQQ